MIKDLTTSIFNRYNSIDGTALRKVNTGGLYFQLAPHDVAEPFIVFFWIASSPVDYAGGQKDRYENVDIQFSLFSKTDDGGIELGTISEKLMLLFDWCELTYPVGSELSHIAFERTSTANVGFVDDVWQYVINYEVKLQH